MRRHKWGIFWLVLLTWNAVSLGIDLATDQPWWALIVALAAAMCAAGAYRDLTKARVGSVTITITPDTSAYDDAMKRAMEAASDVARERRTKGWTPPRHGGYRATPRKGGYTGGPKPPKGPGG